MSTNRWDPKAKKPPKGFAYLAPVLSSLENELRDKVRESNANKRNTESMWPVHQINWQRSRYVYDMYYTHRRISKRVYDYCVRNRLVDPALIAKWKKTGYERLCSTYVINSNNYKFGTTSICRVPLRDRSPEQLLAMDPTTGCRGCASGVGQPRNIFGNKYGQNLAAVQIAREMRMEELEQRRGVEAARKGWGEGEGGGGEGDSETEGDDDNDDDDDEFGPTPAGGVWAKDGSKLESESERLAEGGGGDGGGVIGGDDDEDDDDNDDDNEDAPRHQSKKLKT
ncbi:hypothetical protein ACHAXA_009171 [Cyclostephanos tholiformis]|uniref:G10 protein n=1 Tax=Cyclostephanos tholiformis TaxID=382380 RepID=A0ABD3RU78_9STRA